MSKEEIRRAARDAFPKAKQASTARRRGTGGAYSKRTRTVAARPAARNSAPKSPSIRRLSAWAWSRGFLYFALDPVGFKSEKSTTSDNLIIAAVGVLLFTGINYWAERFRYRRYLAKHKDSLVARILLRPVEARDTCWGLSRYPFTPRHRGLAGGRCLS